ncbi:MAG: hypothetical protein R2729_24550 [Bryobacteraceae bacterium]
MKKRYTVLLMAMAAGAAIAAPVVDPARPDARAIVDRAIDALGGQHFTGMQDRTLHAWTGAWHDGVAKHARTRLDTLYTADGVRERHTFDKKETHWLLFAGNEATEVTFRGQRPLAPEKAAALRDATPDNILEILRHRTGEPGFTATYRGPDICEKQSGYVVDVAASIDDPLLTVCFSQTTGLPISQTERKRDPQSGLPYDSVIVFSRYTEAGGVVWPRHVARLEAGELVGELFVEAMEVNTGLPAERFFLPVDLARLR